MHRQAAVLACRNALRLLAAAALAAAAAALAGSVRHQLLTFAATTPCHGCTSAVSVELRLRCWPHGGLWRYEGDYRMPSWFASSVSGEVLLEALAAAACFFYCLLLLLQVVLLLHEGKHTRCRVPERIASQRQRCLKRARSKKSGLCHSRG